MYQSSTTITNYNTQTIINLHTSTTYTLQQHTGSSFSLHSNKLSLKTNKLQNLPLTSMLKKATIISNQC